MSRPRYYWYGFVVKTIRRYDKLVSDDTQQSVIAKRAIDHAIANAERHEDGELRMKFMRLAYIDNRLTMDAAADAVHVSTRTAQRWLQEFVYDVARECGFKR